ncbi:MULTISPECIES: methyltransferase domain-containing protein [Methylomonas]|uniref:SAM-dependent methyltransferase n=2 Tax=Methylomonas TaxID=416 RepID=A0A140E5T3_9GAMM|nr:MULTISPECIES: methyltransferase domain-containing protein [Methylomonas]AMK78757.1 SAM-dependent methyltransferase [Methylomonas denitrificans]OAI08418.1 SAM-dependent methyltransferase [Methylomonas methanica]TCV83487.1 trans-aconitate methyltransferase [Methylomonas methanica]
MNTYRWNAQDYAQNSRAQQQWAKELIALLQLSGHETVLDLGCGDGKVTAEIARIVDRGAVVGIDNSAAMIALAQGRYPDQQHPNLSFRVMDAGNLSFTECFDVVFSNAVLHWVKQHQPVIDGLYRSLKSGGKILLRMGGQGDAAGMRAAIDQVKDSAPWSRYFIGFEFPYTFSGVDEYRVMLDAAGFNVKRLELVAKDMSHDGRTGLASWIRTTWLPYTQRIPEDLRESFIDAVCSSYLDQVPLCEDGKAHVAMVLLEVEAEKSANLKPA